MSKVYDCFMFSYSPDLLEIRLNILDEVVDKFVIVESPYGFNGNFKGMVFTREENLKRFEKFLHKIEYVPVFDMPKYEILDGEDAESAAFRLENFNRNAISRGIKDAHEDDIIMVSDFDEIPDPEIIKKYKDSNIEKLWWLTLPTFWFKLNTLEINSDPNTTHTVIFRKSLLEKYRPHDLRFVKTISDNGDWVEHIYHGGWHFSWVGDDKFINEKLDGYAHQQFRSDSGRKFLTDELKVYDVNAENFGTRLNIPIDSFLPQYLVDNQTRYQHMISKIIIDQSGHELVDKIYNLK